MTPVISSCDLFHYQSTVRFDILTLNPLCENEGFFRMKTKRNFWFDLGLLGWLGLTFMSLAISSTTHAAAGLLMALGSIVHLSWHWDWVKTVLLRPSGNLPKRRRGLRRVNVMMCLCFGVCIPTGVMTWLQQTMLCDPVLMNAEAWASLHRLSGMMMFLLLGIHLLQHWRWLMSAARRYILPGAHQSKAKTAVEG
jgi:hypothetical protein